jgi:hypothetical protein
MFSKSLRSYVAISLQKTTMEAIVRCLPCRRYYMKVLRLRCSARTTEASDVAADRDSRRLERSNYSGRIMRMNTKSACLLHVGTDHYRVDP